MEIDIRTVVVSPTEIIFADNKGQGDATKILHTRNNKENPVWIDDHLEDICIAICSKEDAENLIKSLQMAISLGWFDKEV